MLRPRLVHTREVESLVRRHIVRPFFKLTKAKVAAEKGRLSKQLLGSPALVLSHETSMARHPIRLLVPFSSTGVWLPCIRFATHAILSCNIDWIVDFDQFFLRCVNFNR